MKRSYQQQPAEKNLISNKPGELPFGGIAPECVRFQDGLIMYRDGLVPKREAGVIAEMRGVDIRTSNFGETICRRLSQISTSTQGGRGGDFDMAL